MSSARIAIAILFLAGVNWAQTGGIPASLDAYIKPYADSNNFSGSVLVERDGRVLFEKSYGMSDRERNIPNSPATGFHVASVSMQFTAGAVLRLVDQGKIKLDTSVSELLPDMGPAGQITIRDLLMQRSGLPDINERSDYSEILKNHQTPAELVSRVTRQPLLFPPGSKYLHEEHSAYNLLALIIEKKTGLPFAEAMKKLVFEPAKLSATNIDEDQPVMRADAFGYQPEGVTDLKPAAAIHWSAKAGNASVVTTVRDQARWVKAELMDSFLKDPTRREVLATEEKVGFGWFRGTNSRFQKTAYYMNGRAPGFASFVLYLPQERLTVVALSNTYSSATTTLGYDITAICLNLPYQPFRPNLSGLSPKTIQTSTGSFQFGADFYQADALLTTFAQGQNLALRWPGGDISPLIPIAADRYIDRAYWQDVFFDRDETGWLKALTYDRFRGTFSQLAEPGKTN